jgi:stage V sporulation protein K
MNQLMVAQKAKDRLRITFHPAQSEAVLAENEPVALDSYPKLAACFEELQSLVGMKRVKCFVHEIFAWLEITRRREEVGLHSEKQVLHMIFTGNPGTGKTTVARILARLFQKMGVLEKGHLVEAERADLVGEYIGHTAQRTRELIKRALGGILFIDEAYTLIRGGEKDFGKEAIDTLVKAMEDHKDQLILILAGYSQEMQHFIAANPGLPSRFPISLHFPDFSLKELMTIAEQMLKEKEYRLTPSAEKKLRRHLLEVQKKGSHNFGNARYVRNLLEQAIRQQAVRLLQQPQTNRDELMTIQATDLRLTQSPDQAMVY